MTPDEVNALPDRVRRHIHDLETRCDPAGMVQDISALKAQVQQLTLALKQTRDEVSVREYNRQLRAFCDGKKWPY